MEPHLQYRNKLIISGDNRWEANLSSSRRPHISICPVPRLPGLAGVNINANVNILINTGQCPARVVMITLSPPQEVTSICICRKEVGKTPKTELSIFNTNVDVWTMLF